MKAAVIRKHGDVHVVAVEEVPDPRPSDNDVLVEVHAAALNHLDIWVRKGRPGLQLTFPHVLGSDATGVVASVGKCVRDIQVGAEVVINPGLSCGRCEFCRRGEQSECESFTIVGLGSNGTFAQYVVVPASRVLLRPSHLTREQAAALPLAHLTAWRMLMNRAYLRPGETVLIHGIGGGVAIAALQLAKVAGAIAIVTSSSSDKLMQAKELGADVTINYKQTTDVAGAIRETTQGRGVDVCIDAVGAATWSTNFAAVRKGGRIVHCGVTTGAETPVNISALYWNHLTVMGSTMGSDEDFRQMLAAVAATKLSPVIDTIFPLANVLDAQSRMESGDQFGKIVLAPIQ